MSWTRWLAAMVVVWLGAERAEACCACLPCEYPPTDDPRSALEKAEFVFSGTVTSTLGATALFEQRAVIAVDRVWKGSVTSRFSVPMPHEESCGAWSVGDRLVWFGVNDPDEGITYGPCSGTRPDVGVSDQLGPGSPPRPLTVSVLAVVAPLGALIVSMLMLRSRRSRRP